MTHPLRSIGITPPRRYYEAVRPSPAHRYFQPHGWSRLCFSLSIAGQVLTFRTRAWSSFALPTRRMPLGRYQDIHRAAAYASRVVLPPPMQGSLPAGRLAFTGRELNPLDRYKRFQIIISFSSSGFILAQEGPSFISRTVAHHRVDRRCS